MSTRRLPDSDISLRDARDYIVSSPLARKAIAHTGQAGWPIVLHDLIEIVHRLVQSCHMPEFTDHGLPHLCSLIDRLSLWESPNGPSVLNNLSAEECATLLLGTLLHDLGMLSQSEADLPANPPAWAARDQAIQLADWVRRTHVIRLPALARRVLAESGHAAVLNSRLLETALQVAVAHQKWPWTWSGGALDEPRHRAIAALIAVSDLLDEDSAWCDTTTLLRHREGTALNRAHWLRHGLTANRVLVSNGSISVTLQRPPSTDALFTPVFCALRNHFRLATVYNSELAALGAEIRRIQFDPCTGIPIMQNVNLADWSRLPEYATDAAFCFHVLHSFMPEALKDEQRVSREDMARLRSFGMEDVDLSLLRAAISANDPRSELEQTFHAIAGT